MEAISTSPWPWYVAGPIITFIMVALLFVNKRFGISSSFETICTIGGAGSVANYFKVDWRSKKWSLLFVLGAIIGGVLSTLVWPNVGAINLNPNTLANLEALGLENIGETYLPSEIFSAENLSSPYVILLLLLGGFLIGFGTRYAGGCTSGHAISGLSNLELPSLIAVIGFFIGGLVMTHILLPKLLLAL